MEIYFDYDKVISALSSVSSLKNTISNIVALCNFDIPSDFEGTELINTTIEMLRKLESTVDKILGALMECIGQLQSIGAIEVDPMTLTTDLNKIINFETLSDNSKDSMAYLLQHCDKIEMMNFINSNITNFFRKLKRN